MKYCIAVEYYYECPVHGGGSFSHIKFFNTIKSAANYFLENLNEYGPAGGGELYNCKTGKYNHSIYTISSNHSHTGIKVEINYRGRKIWFYTVDDGHGKLKWVRK